MTDIRGIPVVRNPMIPLSRKLRDGRVVPVLCVKIPRPVDLHLWIAPMPFGDGPHPAPPTPPPPTSFEIHVHPDRWDAFWLAVNQPDIFMAPEVREMLGLPLPATTP